MIRSAVSRWYSPLMSGPVACQSINQSATGAAMSTGALSLAGPINPELGPSQPRSRSFSTTPDKKGILSGKVAIVTASTDGIGLAIARQLAKDGAQVMISSRKAKNVEQALADLKSQGLDVAGRVCHVGSAEDRSELIKATIDAFGGIDVLVSNAAVNPFFGQILDCPEEAWDKIFDINVKAAFLLFKECKPALEARGGGSAVFVSSIGGFQPIPMLGPYSVSKTALLGLTKALAAEVAADNIRVNCLAPGIVRTKFASAITETDAFAEKVLETVPLNRFGKPEEMGGIVSFLASDAASYITGENFVVAGGINSRL